MKNENQNIFRNAVIFGRCIKWDLLFTLRYNILTVAVVITILYTLIFKLIPGADMTKVIVSFISSDPVMLGFMFIGAMVLFEKDANTLKALTVTPLKEWQYLWSKAISLTVIALFCSIGMAIAARGFSFNYFYFISGVSLSSLLFIFIGFIGVSRVKTFNQYIILIPLFLLPAVLPYIHFFGLSGSPVFYVIPTQGTLILLRAAFEGGTIAEVSYSLTILGISVWIAFKIAEKHFVKYIVTNQ